MGRRGPLQTNEAFAKVKRIFVIFFFLFHPKVFHPRKPILVYPKPLILAELLMGFHVLCPDQRVWVGYIWWQPGLSTPGAHREKIPFREESMKQKVELFLAIDCIRERIPRKLPHLQSTSQSSLQALLAGTSWV